MGDGECLGAFYFHLLRSVSCPARDDYSSLIVVSAGYSLFALNRKDEVDLVPHSDPDPLG